MEPANRAKLDQMRALMDDGRFDAAAKELLETWIDFHDGKPGIETYSLTLEVTYRKLPPQRWTLCAAHGDDDA